MAGRISGPAHWQEATRSSAVNRAAKSGGRNSRKRRSDTLRRLICSPASACLTVDACVSPQGDLVVACHTGPPDWGTGPAGEGRLFKIRYTGRALPQPVLAWAAAPDEFRVAFDRALDPADWAAAKERVKIEAGRYVSAGDRFETVRPGYQVVRDQMVTPRRWLDVLGLTLSADQRTLVLRVPRQSEPVNYAITLPLPDAWKQSGGLAQHPQIDVLATLNVLAANVSDRMEKNSALCCRIRSPRPLPRGPGTQPFQNSRRGRAALTLAARWMP